MILFRAIALSMALLVGLGTIIPLATSYAEAGSKQKRSKKKRAKYRKYSKKWWRNYRQRKNRQRSTTARKRSLRLRQIRLANARKDELKAAQNQNLAAKNSDKRIVEDTPPVILPSGDATPKGWKRNAATSSEMQFRIDDNGNNVGSASISVVGPAVGGSDDNVRSKTVGGVQTSALRRTIIDRMINEQGWVVNDYQKQVGSKKVYVVVAQSPGANGVIQSRLFYFAEVDGRIYSVATNSPKDNIERIEQESEKVINSLQRKPNPTQQADLK